jgi:hypothetical protein
MMKKTLISSFMVVTALLVGSVDRVQATASTHIWAPSTDIQAYKLVHITSDMYLPTERDASGATVATVTNLGLTVGVLPYQKFNMEIGFDHKSGLGDLDSHPLYGNLKIGIPENALGRFSPALAVGIFDVGTKADLTDFNVVYFKLARTFSAGKTSLGRFSLGYFSGNDKLLLDGEGHKDNTGVLVAWERTMTEWSDKLWLCTEYMGSESAYGTFNVGLAWKFAPNVALLGAVDIFNNSDLAGTSTIQVDIDI